MQRPRLACGCGGRAARGRRLRVPLTWPPCGAALKPDGLPLAGPAPHFARENGADHTTGAAVPSAPSGDTPATSMAPPVELGGSAAAAYLVAGALTLYVSSGTIGPPGAAGALAIVTLAWEGWCGVGLEWGRAGAARRRVAAGALWRAAPSGRAALAYWRRPAPTGSAL